MPTQEPDPNSTPFSAPKLPTPTVIQLEQNSRLPYTHVDYVNASWLGLTVSLTFFQVDYHGLGVALDQAREANSREPVVGQAYVVSRVAMDRDHFVGVLREMLAAAGQMGINPADLAPPPPPPGSGEK